MILLGVLFVLMVIDAISTYYGLKMGAKEANPLSWWAINLCKVGALIVLYFVNEWWLTLTAILIFSFVVYNNMKVIRMGK